MNLANIRIVLVNTTHPGNIGAVARAMKNMGLNQLVLVAPKIFPSEQADVRASGATDILLGAQVVDTLEQALADVQVVVGSSARGRHIPWPVMSPRQLAAVAQCATDQASSQVAIVFGREDRGLTNQELQLCHYHVHIPSVEHFSSLNLASAVQVIAYELRMVALAEGDIELPQWGVDWDVCRATHQEQELLFQHLEQVLITIDFLDPDNPRQLMPRLRRLLQRATLDQVEVNVLRGILTHFEKKLASVSERDE